MQAMTIQQLLMNRPLTIMMIAPRTNPKNHLKQVSAMTSYIISSFFLSDNVIICQYERVTRQRNKWKIHLKDGIMNLDGKEYVFSSAAGDTDW